MRNDRIVMGFQNTVDFELAWQPAILEGLVGAFGIRDAEIGRGGPVETERDMVLALLGHLRDGTGTERMVASSETTRAFAARFPYAVTLGGTAVRAAIALAQLGIPSTVHACSLNRHFRALMPKNVAWRASVPDEGENFHPHVIVQFPAGARVRAGDIDITASRPNRVIFAHDPPSEALVIDETFQDCVTNAGVFLAASYNVMKDEALLEKRLASTLRILDSLPAGCVTVMEDGCFENGNIRAAVSKALGPRMDLFSLNEDELQDRAGQTIDILDAAAVARAVTQVAAQVGANVLVCHSAHWALAFGRAAARTGPALAGGIQMAATRLRMGDAFGPADYAATGATAPSAAGVRFCAQITRLLGAENTLCLPGLDLRSVAHPTTIGLGDAFVGGMLPNLLPENATAGAPIV